MAAKDLRTIKQVPKERPWTTEPALRSLINKAELNGLEVAIVRVGRRVLVDLSKFDEWVEKGREG